MGRAIDLDAEEANRRNHLLAAIVESSHDAIVSKDLDGVVTSWNRGAQLVFGYAAEEMIGKPILTLIPPERHSEEVDILARLRRGEKIEHYETVRRRKDGTLIHVSLTISPIREDGGRIVGASKIARDISERVRAEETQRLLMREVNHRSKNLLAVVEAMVRKTASTTPPQELIERVSQRLQALSAIQNLLVYGDWRGVDLRTLIATQAAPYSEGRSLDLQGPNVVLLPAAAQALGLAFHELASNAARHGSLSREKGTVRVEWSVPGEGDERALSLTWSETHGPEVAAPTTTAFGTTILKRATEDALGAKVAIDYDAEGLVWRLDAPATETMV